MNKLRFHVYLDNQLSICGKTQKEIAEELNYEKPNIITMFKQGRTKVPLDKIEPLAKAIGVDPVFLLRMAMTEYMPQAWAVIEKIAGHAVTENEFEMIKIIRQNVTSDDPHLSTANQRKQLASFAKSL